MGVLAVIGTFLKLLFLFFQNKLEKDKERKEKVEKVLEDINEGVKNNDASRINTAIESANWLL